jgi:mxaL protein
MNGWRPGAAALVLLLVALAMPRLPWPSATYDTVVVFDITQSMDVADYALDGVRMSRIDFARAAARRVLRGLPCGSRVGWAAFAEYRTILLLAPVEVCANYSDLVAALEHVDGRMRWGEASEITKGVFWAVRVAQALSPQPNLVFLSDGQEAPPIGNEEHALFDDFKSGQVHGWLLGVGGDTPQPIPHTDADGRRIGVWHADEVMQIDGDPRSHEELSEVREPHLQALAHQVGFDYARLRDVESLAAAIRDSRAAHRASIPTDFTWAPLSAALALLAWRFRPGRSTFDRVRLFFRRGDSSNR